MDVPMKQYWMGQDVETLPREKLLEIIAHLARDLDASRNTSKTILEMGRAFAAARQRF